MHVGVDYYPEHWDEDQWKNDAQLMKNAGFSVIRIGEFAWHRMEPREGHYDFGWIINCIDEFNNAGLQVILGTPSAIVPSWAAHKYPEIMARQKDGTRIVYGMRKNNCFSSPAYRILARNMVKAMTKSLGTHTAVIGWQTDNEFGEPFCTCKTCRHEFQEFLRNTYNTLEALNDAWGLYFWGHTVNSWEEINIPVNEQTFNPSQLLDYKRFHTALHVNVQKEQVELIQKHSPGRFITHNMMGLYPQLDYYQMSRDLDFVSWDNYPNLGNIGAGELSKRDVEGPELHPRTRASMAADLMRGLKRKKFWIMEQTAGPHGWGFFSRTTWPGELRNIAYQQLAHGCDGMLWFRWRSCPAGREQYWHGLLNYDSVPGRRYHEAAQTAMEYHNLAHHIEASEVHSKIAILYDYQSQWAFMFQPAYEGCNYQEQVLRYYTALYERGMNVDLVSPATDFSGYSVVIAPHLYILPDKLARKLEQYVENGGTLLCDCLTAKKNETNLCHTRTLPGLLSKTLGIEIHEYEALEQRYTYTFGSDTIDSESGKQEQQAILYCDWVETTTAAALYSYRTPHVQSYAVLTENSFGKGKAFYMGTIAVAKEFYDSLIVYMLGVAGLSVGPKLPDGIQWRTRQTADSKFVFVINHLNAQVLAPLPQGIDILSGKECGGHELLEPFGVRVIDMA